MGTYVINSLDEISYLDGTDHVDTTIKVITNPGGTVMTGAGPSAVTVRNNGIPISTRAVAKLKLYVYYLKNIERVKCKPIANSINLFLVCSYRDQKWHDVSIKNTAEETVINDKDLPRNLEMIKEYLAYQYR
jgi:hypothetical protein